MNKIMEIKNLETHFLAHDMYLTAVRGLSLDIYENEILGLVGESGCGKSVTLQSIMRLYDSDVEFSGEILFEGVNLLALKEKDMREIRRKKLSMVFQNPLNSLNPLFPIGQQLTESAALSGKYPKDEVETVAVELLDKCGIPSPKARLNSYPHELSGGMQQRVMIAIALAKKPRILFADEPTTALDVTIQAEVLQLFKELNEENGTSMVFVTHDLGVVKNLCHRVAVMYLGEIVEIAETEKLFDLSMHPYTVGLMKSIPTMDTEPKAKLNSIPGRVTGLRSIESGCAFANRCDRKSEHCTKSHPELIEIGEGHFVRCHHPLRNGGGV